MEAEGGLPGAGGDDDEGRPRGVLPLTPLGSSGLRRAAKAIPLLASLAGAGDPCRVPLDRPYTLGHPVTHPLEAAHGRIAAGESPLGFAFPIHSERECAGAPRPRLAYADSAAGRSLGLLALVGEEYRSEDGGPWATEAGGLLAGRNGPVSFHLDARMYTEAGGDRARPSFDREDVDEQEAETSGSIDYRSYSRFRGDLTLSLPFGRLSAARDAAHWGPGLFTNPALHQAAVPFFQYAFSTELGPLRVTSLYGDLAIGRSQSASAENLDTRSLYAHRYELSLGRSWLLGLTEQLILFDMRKAYLFVPVFPLFVAKGYLVEDRTNGNLAADLTWRSPWSGILYGEFLLDDLESPSSLLTEEYIQNKWAAMAGAHWPFDLGGASGGLVAEVSHVEPWVYAHFEPSTAQAAHAGHPLGNPQGADSRSVIVKAYARPRLGLYAGVKAGLYWKGKGASANIDQPVPETPTARKSRLEGEGGPDMALEPEAAFTARHMHLFAAGRIAADGAFRMGARFFF